MVLTNIYNEIRIKIFCNKDKEKLPGNYVSRVSLGMKLSLISYLNMNIG